MDELLLADPELAAIIAKESDRQMERLELIASENYTSPAVRQAQGSILTHKYAEGYPGKRYYGGCEFVDTAETLAQNRAKKLFGADFVNVQPHAGSPANMAVYFALLQPGDTIMGMDLSHGGHLTHGSPVSFSGKLYKSVSYGVSKATGQIDYDDVERIARDAKPQLIVAGASAYPRKIDFARFRAIADSVGALLMVDMAHIAGLVATGHHESPVPHAQVITTTTHKTLRGPRGGMILGQGEFEKKVNSAVFPGMQGGPLMHVIAAKAVALGEALTPAFSAYSAQMLANARVLADTLMATGYNLVSGGTDNHLMLVDLTNKDITGKEAEVALDKAGITVNKNTIPFETRSPFVTSGIRLGSAALTTRGFTEEDFRRTGRYIIDALEHRHDEGKLVKIHGEVKEFARQFPLFHQNIPEGAH